RLTTTIPNPSSVTAGVTTNGSTPLTSATANCFHSDNGKTITGAGIPPGTWIASINSATSVTMSAAATSPATGVTIVIARGAESVDGCFDPTAAPGAAFTDAVTTYNSYTLTSATANFLSSDVGLSIQGAYIPPGTTIQS